MDAWRDETGGGGKAARDHLQLEGVSDEELTCLFGDAVAVVPAVQAITASHPPENVNVEAGTSNAVLTLGDASALVRVQPDRSLDRDMPLFHGSWRKEQNEPAIHRLPAAMALQRSSDMDEAVAPVVAPAGQVSNERRFEPDREAMYPIGPFSWRRMFKSAIISGGIGTAALLALQLLGR